jgi:photosystem II stability/assembly factor-like uncharacterized protein
VGGNDLTGNGFILATKDGGDSWHTQRLNNGTTTPPLYSVCFVNALTGWAVGAAGVIIATRDGGTTWTVQHSGVTRVLRSVYFLSPLTGWAVGPDGVILATRDGGKTWDHSSRNGALHSVYFINSTTGWIAGASGTILATTDGGRTWNRQPSLGLEGLPDLYSIHFVDSKTGWTAGSGGILATVDGGKTWHQQERRTTLTYVHFANSSLGTAVGGNEIYITIDGGNTWELQDRLDVNTKLYCSQGLDATTTWIVGSNLGSPEIVKLVPTEAQSPAGTLTEHRLPQLPFHLVSVHFINPSTGWAVGEAGTILATSDGGKTWTTQNSRTDADFASVYFVNPKSGCAVGKRNLGGGDRAVIFATSDGGQTWNQRYVPGDPQALSSVQFVDSTTGWAVGSGIIITTTDGGQTWSEQNVDDASLPDLVSLYFVNETTGWAAGANDHGSRDRPPHGVIVTTTDAGKTWHSSMDNIPNALKAIYFVNPLSGWAVGDHGLVLATRDAGKTWTQQPTLTDANLMAVHFVNTFTGWTGGSGIAGDGLVMLATTDGGKTWKGGPLTLAGRLLSPIRNITFYPGFTTGWAVGPNILLKATLSEQAAFATDPKAVDILAPAGVLLEWAIQHKSPRKVTCTKVDFRTGDDDWRPIKLASDIAPQRDGIFRIRWNPTDYGVSAGSRIRYRVTLRAPEDIIYVQELRGSYVYKPWWDSQGSLIRGAMIATALSVALILAYFLTCFVLLRLHPLGLLWLNDHLDLKNVLALAPTNWLAPILSAIFAPSALHYFATHDRTRRAWITEYRSGGRDFSNLQPTVRAAFVSKVDCLDAWVERRRDKAQMAFERIKSVSRRQLYIELPVRIGAALKGRRVSEPKPENFRAFIDQPRTVLAIIGEGGTGKSTLACQLGRWAIAEDPAQCLATFQMIPIFLEEDTSDLLVTLTGHLKRMVGEDDIAPDLVKELLRTKRLLVIVDALSERSFETQKHIQTIHEVAPINAMLLTSRRPPEFGPTAVTHLWPEPLSADKLVYFVTEYLARTEAEAREARARGAETPEAEACEPDLLFPGRETLNLAERLLDLFEIDPRPVEAKQSGTQTVLAVPMAQRDQGDRGVRQDRRQSLVTPLLVRLFIDQAIDLRKKQRSIESLPTSIPEVILNFLRLVNPEDNRSPNVVHNDLMIEGARVLGWTSLGNVDLTRFLDDRRAVAPDNSAQLAFPLNALTPGDFYRDVARDALRARHISFEPDQVIDRLIANGVLIENKPAGTSVLRFNLDPVAEHLAALHLTDTLRSDATGWKQWLALIQRVEGFPQRISGFLHALEDCIGVYQAAFSIPVSQLPWQIPHTHSSSHVAADP